MENMMRFPSINDVSAELRDANKETLQPEDADEGIDVRLRVYPDSSWVVLAGSPDYDQDHHGYVGSAMVPGNNRRFDSKAVARDLIEQAREHKATGGEEPRAGRVAAKRKKASSGIDFSDQDAVLDEVAAALDIPTYDLDIITNTALESFGTGDVYEIRFKHKPNGKTWTVVENYDQQRALAIEIVKQDLEEDPSVFNKDFIEQHINMDRLKRDLESDVHSEKYDYYSEIGDDRFWREAEQLGMDVPEEDEDGNMPEPDTDDYEKAADIATEDAMKDPMAYLEDIYGDDAAKQAIEIAGIDVNAAAEDAVDTDGEAHFLARYDSNDYHTKNGLVYWRDN
jgi:hypothetical protein